MSFSDKAKQIIGTVAPLLGTALGGPLGGLAGGLLAKALGTDDPKAQEAAIAAADPQTLLKLKEAENELQEHMKQLQIDEEKLGFDDTANARAREIAVKDSTPKILGYGIIIFTMFFEGWLLIHGMPKDMDPQYAIVAGRILGTFDTASALVLGYFYGTSAGSSHKDSTIDKMIAAK